MLSPYHAMSCNPVTIVDPTGLSGILSMAHSYIDAMMVSPVITTGGPRGSNISASLGAEWEMAGARAIFMKMVQDAINILSSGGNTGYATSTTNGSPGCITGGMGSASGVQQTVAGTPVNVIELGYKVMTNQIPDGNGNILTESGVEAQFFVSNSTYSEYQWLQTVATSSPQSGKTSPYLDEASANSFFYYSSAEIQNFVPDLSRLGYNAYFYDGSTRDIRELNVSWSAQLTLVGRMKAGEQWSPIVTIEWGWDMVNGVVASVPWKIIPFSSSRNQNHLNTRNSSSNP